jgi:eukaryotic-like serine/threonine-protein kinase
MTPEQWQEVKKVLAGALERTPEDRRAYLDHACTDPSLRREVESLIQAHERARTEFLQAAAAHSDHAFLLKRGTRLGVYEILAPLGAGGMGEVYRARDTRLDRIVALKILPEGFAAKAERMRRFEREAKLLASLNHPNIAAIYGLEASDSMPALVMELVEGLTLAERIAAGPIPLEDALPIARQLADAIEYAHRQGVIHRDLKPANIKVNSEGTVKVLDFGLATVQRGLTAAEGTTLSQLPMADGLQEALTSPGIAMGTVAYMSPEQALGQEVDGRSDLFSLGVVLYEMFTRQLPFQGTTAAAIFNAILNKAPAPPGRINPDLPSELEGIINKCLEKDRGLRYQSAADLRADLKRVGRDHDAGGVAAAGLRPDTRQTAHRRAVRRATILAVLMLMIGAIFAYFYSTSSRSPALSPSEYVQLTNFTDSATEPSLSPDGRMVTFIRGGHNFPLGNAGQVYVKLLPDGESQRLTNDNTLKFGPVFSPNGSRITYTVPWDTWTVPVLGGQPTRLLPNASGLVWLDDRHVLFSKIKGTGFHMGIVTATEDRSEERAIYFPTHERAMAHFSWASPDRRWILLVEMDRTARWQPCRLVPFDGSSPGRQVGPHGACTAAAWGPHGRWMYFSAVVNGASHLWRQRFPDGRPEQITSGPTEEEGVALAPNGKSVVTSVGIRESSIWRHDTAGDRVISSEGDAFAPQLSVDGRRVYYLLRRNHSYPALELRESHLDSGDAETVLRNMPVRLPDVTIQAADYEISRDEREVVFAKEQGRVGPEIWLASLDRSTPPRLLARGGDEVSFGSSGDILFRSLEGKANFLSRIKKDGSGREHISSTPILNKFAVSPDGNWVLASVPATGEQGEAITVAVSTRGEASQRICPGYCPGRWTADGRFLFLVLEAVRGMTGTTLALPVPPGSSLPVLPRSGLPEPNPRNIRLPGAVFIHHVMVIPGRDPTTYVFVQTDVRRNLFRIPLH